MRLLLLPLLGVLPGCLQSEQTVTLAADGSGTQSLAITLTDEVLAVARQYLSVAGTAARADAVFEEAHVRRELQECGLALASFAVRGREQARVLDLSVTFPGVAALRRSPLAGSRAQWFFLRGQGEAIRVVFYPQGKEAHDQALAKIAEMQQKGFDPAVQSWFARQKERLRDLDVRFALRLPGNVEACSANWVRRDARTVASRVTAAAILTPDDLLRALAPRYEVTFDGKGCTLPLDAAEPTAR
jgi:hypothetical protein